MKLLFAVRNVAAHAQEMGQAAPRDPVFFQKPLTSLQDPPSLHLPTDIGSIEFEAELAVQVAQPLSRASPEEAAEAIGPVGVILDLTARQLQADRKQEGLPWFEAKGFDGACVAGHRSALEDDQALEELEVSLTVNGQQRQRFAVGDYTVQPADLLARCSRWVSLEPGDILGCGTGEGVGPLRRGDTLEAELVGLEGTRFDAEVVHGPR